MEKWNNNLNDGQIFDSGGLLVANCYSSLKSPQTIKAHAKLIAAAPELLEALKDLVKAHETGMGKSAIALRIELAKDAIKKATE